VTVGTIVGHRLLMTVSGLVALAFGLLLIMSPSTGILSVLWLVGFYAIFAGFTYIAMGYDLRNVSDAARTLETGVSKSVDAGTTASGS
jgi:uncharacterized membrane protein HdeD (DUF308 family)